MESVAGAPGKKYFYMPEAPQNAEEYMQPVQAMTDPDVPSRIFFGDEFSALSVVLAVLGVVFIIGGAYIRKVNQRPAN